MLVSSYGPDGLQGGGIDDIAGGVIDNHGRGGIDDSEGRAGWWSVVFVGD